MQTGRGVEETEISGGVGEGGCHQGFKRIWVPPREDELLQVPGIGDIGGRLRLAGGNEELVPGKGGLKEDGTHPQQGGGGPAGVRILF